MGNPSQSYMEHHLPHGITLCYQLPNTGERALL